MDASRFKISNVTGEYRQMATSGTRHHHGKQMIALKLFWKKKVGDEMSPVLKSLRTNVVHHHEVSYHLIFPWYPKASTVSAVPVKFNHHPYRCDERDAGLQSSSRKWWRGGQEVFNSGVFNVSHRSGSQRSHWRNGAFIPDDCLSHILEQLK